MCSLFCPYCEEAHDVSVNLADDFLEGEREYSLCGRYFEFLIEKVIPVCYSWEIEGEDE